MRTLIQLLNYFFPSLVFITCSVFTAPTHSSVDFLFFPCWQRTRESGMLQYVRKHVFRTKRFMRFMKLVTDEAK